MGEKMETVVPWVGKMWFDMELDWMVDYVKKTTGMSKIDQVLTFYWIPYRYKNNVKAYLKYKPRESHCAIINDYFLSLYASGMEWFDDPDFDYSDFDYLKLQKKYNETHPEDEQTGLNLHVNYWDFLDNDKKHNEAIQKENTQSVWFEEMRVLTDVMKWMMDEMKSIKQTIGLLSPNAIPNDNTSQKIGETWSALEESGKWTATSWGNWGTETTPSWGEWSEKIWDDNSNTSTEPLTEWLSQSKAIDLIIPNDIDTRLGDWNNWGWVSEWSDTWSEEVTEQ